MFSSLFISLYPVDAFWWPVKAIATQIVGTPVPGPDGYRSDDLSRTCDPGIQQSIRVWRGMLKVSEALEAYDTVYSTVHRIPHYFCVR